MPKNKASTAPSWTDPDDAPELTDEFFERASLYEGERLIQRGHPAPSPSKEPLTLHLPAEVLHKLRSSGAGWQARLETLLTEYAASYSAPPVA